MLCSLKLYLVLLSVVGIPFEVECFYFLYTELCPPQLQNNVIVSLLAVAARWLLAIICMDTSARVYAVFLMSYLFFARIYDCLMRSVGLLYSRGLDIHKALRLFDRLRITLLSNNKGMQLTLFAMLGVGLFGTVLMNYGTLKLYSVIPLVGYTIFPLLSCLSLCLIQITLSNAIKIYENSAGVLESFGRSLINPCGRKYLLRKLRSLRPAGMECGVAGHRFITIKRCTKVEYYYSIVDFTITAVLSIPSDVFS